MVAMKIRLYAPNAGTDSNLKTLNGIVSSVFIFFSAIKKLVLYNVGFSGIGTEQRNSQDR